MVKCESYYGVPGSGTPGSQPFSIIVNPVALATMDLHAHLVKTEVIGLLAGEWNMEEKSNYKNIKYIYQWSFLKKKKLQYIYYS